MKAYVRRRKYARIPGPCTLSLDGVRELYYAVLGLAAPGQTLKEEFNSLKPSSWLSVDMPEDTLKVERVMELRGEIKPKSSAEWGDLAVDVLMDMPGGEYV